MRTEHTNDLDTQLNAAQGFTEWLASTSTEQPKEDHEYKNQLAQFLKFYELELQRRIDGTQATLSWFDAIAVQSTLGPLLKDNLLEQHPELATYGPNEEPTTVQEMAMRLLQDALALFADGQREMGSYLVQPVAVGVLDDLIERVLKAPTVEAEHAF